MLEDKFFYTFKGISKIVYDQYKELATLEKNNKINTKEFDDVLKSLEESKALERKLCDAVKKKNNNFLTLGIYANAIVSMKIGINPEAALSTDPGYIILNEVLENDLICMRICANMHDMYIHDDNSDPEELFLYDVSLPLINKIFLDILSSQINDSEFKDYRNMLIDAKYDYAFVHFKECEMPENYYAALGVTATKCASEILKYSEDLCECDKEYLMSGEFRREFILLIDYLRSNMMILNSEKIDNIRETIEILSQAGAYGNNEGKTAVLNILNNFTSDTDTFFTDEFTLKRKF